MVLDIHTNVPILSIQPFNQDGYDYAVKIRTMNVADHDKGVVSSAAEGIYFLQIYYKT